MKSLTHEATMKKNKTSLFIATFLFFLIFTNSSTGQEIIGTASVSLKAPATSTLKAKYKKIAKDSLAQALSVWVNEFFDNCLDPNNNISKHFLDQFVNNCIKNAKVKSYIEGRELTVDYSIPNNVIDSIITSHNARNDGLALNFWKQLLAAQNQNQALQILRNGIKCLYFAKAHIGSPLIVPQVPTNTTFSKHLLSIIQNMVDKTDISFNIPVISGKPPEVPYKEILATVVIDTIPFPQFVILATLPDGRKVTTLTTNDKGIASFKNLKTPFVNNGTFLHVSPNFAAFIDPTLNFSVKDFGLNIGENLDQDLIFNITKPAYKLKYNITAVNKVSIPASFSDEKYIHAFLTDSLPFVTTKGNANSDLVITINCQVSKYTFDKLEQTELKVESNIRLEELKPNGIKLEQTVFLNKKRFDAYQKIPTGLFFWQSSKALRNLIRNMLDDL